MTSYNILGSELLIVRSKRLQINLKAVTEKPMYQRDSRYGERDPDSAQKPLHVLCIAEVAFHPK